MPLLDESDVVRFLIRFFLHTGREYGDSLPVNFLSKKKEKAKKLSDYGRWQGGAEFILQRNEKQIPFLKLT
jgi:hypothetical protein